MVLSLLLAACSPATIVLDDAVPGEGDTDGAADTASADDTGAEDTGAGDTGGEDTAEPPEPVTDFSHWTGSRRYFYDYSEWGYECDETVAETGTLVPEGSRELDALQDACPDCELFYEVSPQADSACDGAVRLGTTWRGVVLSDRGAVVSLYTESDGRLYGYAEDGDASFDGSEIVFAYDLDYNDWFAIEVTGTMTFPVTR